VQITSYFPARPVPDLYGRNKHHFAQHYTPNEKFNGSVVLCSRLKRHEDGQMKVVTYRLVRNYWNVYVQLNNQSSLSVLYAKVLQ
jgi:hypothetical protein